MSRLFDVKVNNYTCDIQRKSFKSILVYKFIANHKHMVFSFVIQYSQQIFLLIHVLYSIMIIHIKNLDNKYVSDRNFKNSAKRLAKDELAKKRPPFYWSLTLTLSYSGVVNARNPTIFNMICWVTGSILSSTKHLMVQVLFWLIKDYNTGLLAGT